MRNLILFLTRNYYFILFLALETFSVFLIIQNNHFQRAHFLNSSNAITGNIYEMASGVTEYFGLKNQNYKLAQENVILRNQLRNSFGTKVNPNVSFKDSIHSKQFIYISAKVVNNSTNRRKNYLTLNMGKNQGITNESGVICGEGIVGIVRDVSDNFSSVMSVLHESARIPVEIKRFNENSILTWNGNDELYGQMERIPSHLEIRKGDTVLTSSYSTIFPEGVMVGTIDSFEKVAGNTFFNVTLKFSTDFSRLKYVTVAKNLMKEEQSNLETNSQK